MAKVVREKYTPKQEDKLLSIPLGPGGLEKVNKLAKKWGKGEPGMRSKWYNLHANKVAKPRTAKHNVERTYASKIAPMIFKSVEFVDPKVKVSQDEQMAMQKGIDSAIKDEQLTTKRAINIPKKYELRAKKYLKEYYPQNVFSFHKDPKDKKMLLLVQKS
jgi:hypothetical protein